MRRNSKVRLQPGKVERFAATMRPLPGPSQDSATRTGPSSCTQVPAIQARLSTRGGAASVAEDNTAAESATAARASTALVFMVGLPGFRSRQIIVTRFARAWTIATWRSGRIDERGGDARLGREELRRRAAHEAAEIADEVALVVVARGDRGLGPRPRAIPLDEIEHAAEAQDRGQQRRPHADRVAKAPLELPPPHARHGAQCL